MDESNTHETALNVLGTPLIRSGEVRGVSLGYFRDGFCNTAPADVGCHAVCAVMTDEFLEYTRQRGNDLSTPSVMYHFPGLRRGDSWCLCAARWREAYEDGTAPLVRLECTHEAALQHVTLDQLQEYAYSPDRDHTWREEGMSSLLYRLVMYRLAAVLPKPDILACEHEQRPDDSP